MPITNRGRVTVLCFLAYFVMSGMLAPWGVIAGTVADFFNTTETDVTTRFGWLTGGNLLGAILALFAFQKIRIKSWMIVLYGLIVTALLSLLFVNELRLVELALGIVGTCCGIGLAGAALTISLTYQAKQRASMLVVTDGCFSIAGYLCSAMAVLFVGWSLHWSMTYQIVALVAACVVVLSLFSTFPTTTPQSHQLQKGVWPLSAWLCVVGLFLYTLGQWSMLWWLPTHLQQTINAPADKAGGLVGLFWLGMLGAQLFVAWWVLRVGTKLVVGLAAVTTAAFSVPLWLVTDLNLLPMFAVLWGFANLGLLKMVLSFATETLSVPSSVLVSSLLLGATTGTAVSPIVTSKIVDGWGTLAVLQFSSVCYTTLTILLLLAIAVFKTKE